MMPYTKAAIAMAMALSWAPDAVVSEDAVCLNDQSYTYNDGGRLRPCSNIRLNEGRRQTLCLLTEVREACPQTCGICCEDDPTFTFPLDNVDVDQDCAWIIKNNVETRRANYCQMDDRIGDTSIRNMCPKACDFCQELVAIEPTASPTKAPTASPTTGAPTKSPTKAPTASPTTGAPTKSPTKAPTGAPTASPTKAPTATPTASPTKAPTASPTKAPTATPTASPTKAPTASPTKSPTASPTTAAPTASPTTGAPTKSPTKAPTASPTTAAPVLPCTDNSSFTWTLTLAGTTVGCEWLTRNSSKSAVRIATYCDDPEIKLACISTCASCACEDDSTFTFELTNIPGEMRDCSWLTTNLEKADIRKENYCASVGPSCPSTCGLC